jgi:hypothetical protein
MYEFRFAQLTALVELIGLIPKQVIHSSGS